MTKIVRVYTDGACRGNPGPGGWGVLMEYNHHQKELSGAEIQTTNNRMELMAAIAALKALKRSCKIIMTTDSEYLQKGITEWITQWKRQDWRTKQKHPVKNVDLWQELDSLVMNHDIEWCWVKGHSGHPGNERADLLANQAIDYLLKKV